MNWFQTIVLLIVLSVWVWVLGRPLAANLFNKARRDPVGSFRREMSALGEAPQRSMGLGAPAMPRTLGGAPTMTSARRRRLQIFMALCIAAGVSLVMALVFRGIWIYEHLLMDVLLVGYTALAARHGAAESERRSKVSYLSPARAQASPVYIRAVNDG